MLPLSMSAGKRHSLSTDRLNLACRANRPRYAAHDATLTGAIRDATKVTYEAYKFPMTCDQIAIIPTNRTIDVSAAASCITVRNMAISLERNKNIVQVLF